MNAGLLRPHLLALATVALAVGCHRPARRPVLPSVAQIEVVRGHVELRTSGAPLRIRGSLRVPREGVLVSDADARSVVRLDGGATLLVDRSSELEVGLDHVELRRGRLFVDARGSNPVELETRGGTLRIEDASVSVVARGAVTDAYAASGEITYASQGGSDRFAQGEQLTLGSGEPKVEPAAVFDDWTGGLATPSQNAGGSPGYIGAIDARSAQSVGIAGEPMSLRSHDVAVVVTDDHVRTETIQTFFNGESELVDGDYRVRVPAGAVVSSFEIDRGAGYEASYVSALATPDMVASGRAYVGGTAKLVFDGPDTYRARIRGISPGQTLRIRLVTSSFLERRSGVRTLSVPLGDGSDAPLVGELSIRVDATHAAARSVTAGHGATVSGKLVNYRASDAKPRSDFVVELFDEEPRTKARAYEGTRSFVAGRVEHFVRLDLPTDTLVDANELEDSPLDLLLVVDSSGGTDDEDLELARATIETLLAQITPRDKIAVRLGDVTLRPLEGSPSTPTALDAAARERLLASIATVETGGATDLGTVLRDASSALAGHANGVVIYLGDGIPTDGAMSATEIGRELELVDDPPRLFAIGLGDDANLGLLRTVAGEATIAVRDRDEAARSILSLLASAGTPVLRNVRIEAVPSLEQLFPRGAVTVPVGQGHAIVARVQGSLPDSLRIRANLGDRAIDERVDLERREAVGTDDVPKRWASARLRELLDEDAGREAITELGLGFDLVTPYTSRVIGAGQSMPVDLWTGVDWDPTSIAWRLSGAMPTMSIEELGGRRAHRAYDSSDEVAASVIESTWSPHDAAATTSPSLGADGGLARASVERVLREGTRGPMGCYERMLLQRPDLVGSVYVNVTVDGTGRVVSVTIVQSNHGYPDLDACVLAEVQGLSFPATLGATVTAGYDYSFSIPGRRIGVPHRCSLASERDLATRRRLWSERVAAANAQVAAALEVFREAQASCELPDWRSRRTLASMLLRSLPSLTARLDFYASFATDPVVAPYLRLEILRSVRSAPELGLARARLGLAPNLDFGAFVRSLTAAASVDAKLALVRRWLEVVPDDIDLRLRLLALLEEAGKLPEARRVARTLHEDPLVDARARTLVGEFWLRHDAREQAVRVFSSLVETAPLDPWARRRLGDLYLAHGFVDDARLEYATLARLRPDDSTSLLLLARAAAASGRTDEALRLEQRVSEEADDDVEEGLSAVARAFTTFRLATMRAEATDPTTRAALEDRLRSTGVLRRPPDIVVTLVWDHPDDELSLEWLAPGAVPNEPWTPASVDAESLGIESFRILEREDGAYRVKIVRTDARDLRPSTARLVVTEGLGTASERTTVQAITLTKDDRELVVEVGASQAVGR